MNLKSVLPPASLCCLLAAPRLFAADIRITDVPNYSWYAGCFGTAGGNLMGYWDRHGFPNFYTGPAAGGVAPLTSVGADRGIRSMWASKAGFDGRPADQPGHIDDYWEWFIDENSYSYESTAPDPYQTAGRPEHTPDCIGDFIGASQNKWKNLDGECSGNIDAFSFNFWDHNGDRRVNFEPPLEDGVPIRDVQSGLRKWTEYRGYAAEVTSQLVDFNPAIPAGKGFTFADLKREIDAGYPVMLILQNPGQLYRDLPGMPHANPDIHAMLAYGYLEDTDGTQFVWYRTSWGDGENHGSLWAPQIWEARMTLRGVITYHPAPKFTSITRTADGVLLKWDGPASVLTDNASGTTWAANWYLLERADSLGGEFVPTGPATAAQEIKIAPGSGNAAFYRLRVLTPGEAGQPQG